MQKSILLKIYWISSVVQLWATARILEKGGKFSQFLYRLISIKLKEKNKLFFDDIIILFSLSRYLNWSTENDIFKINRNTDNLIIVYSIIKTDSRRIVNDGSKELEQSKQSGFYLFVKNRLIYWIKILMIFPDYEINPSFLNEINPSFLKHG